MTKITAALIEAKKAFPQFPMDGKVKFKNISYSFLRLPTLFKLIAKALADNGLTLSTVMEFVDGHTIIKTVLMHTSGESIVSIMPINTSAKPQELGAVITYYRRYQITAILGIAPDEDTDAAEHSIPLDPGSYQINFKGKYQGRTLNTFSDDEVVSFITGIEDWAAKNNKKITGPMKEAIDMANKYLEMRVQ